MKSLIIRHQFRDIPDYYITIFFDKLYQKLSNHYSEYSFEIINDTTYEDNGYGSICSCMNFSIVNPETNNYILISFFDNWKYHFMKHLGWNPAKMKQFFYCGGFNYLDYFNFKLIEKNNADIDCPQNITEIYKPFFYGPYHNNYDDLFEVLYNQYNSKDTINKLYFRGYMWDFRQNMTQNIDNTDILIIDKNQSNNDLNYSEYLEDMIKYRAALSLPGGTEICNRDIECFAVGVPVIRPHLDINYPDPLIPNYHYVDCFHSCKYWDGYPSYIDYGDFAKYISYYWDLIKNNIEYLEFIRTNARLWYLTNCTMENNINYLFSQINLETI